MKMRPSYSKLTDDNLDLNNGETYTVTIGSEFASYTCIYDAERKVWSALADTFADHATIDANEGRIHYIRHGDTVVVVTPDAKVATWKQFQRVGDKFAAIINGRLFVM